MPFWFYSDQSQVNVTFRDSATDATAATGTHTFAASNIGPASAGRYVVIGLLAGSAFVTVNVNSNAMTQLAVVTAVGGVRIALYGLLVPTGTTGTIDVTLGGNSTLWQLIVWSMTGVSTVTPASTATTTADDPSASMSCSLGGAILAVAEAAGGSTPTSVWSGIAKDVDTTSATRILTGAHANFPSAQSSLSCQCTFTGETSGGSAACFAAFNPS